MPLNYNTVAGATTNPAAHPDTFFSAVSTSNNSSTFVVNKEPFYVEVYNLASGDTVTVQQVAGAGSGATFQNFAPLGVPYQLTPAQSKIRIDWPGYYRLVFSGASVNAITCVGFPATMTHDSVFGISPANGGPGGNTIVEGTAPITVTGNGSVSTPYIVSSSAGSATFVEGTAPITVTGSGTSGSPYDIGFSNVSTGYLTTTGSYTITGTWTFTVNPITVSYAINMFDEFSVSGSPTWGIVASTPNLFQISPSTGTTNSLSLISTSSAAHLTVGGNLVWDKASFQVLASAAPTGGNADDCAVVQTGANKGLWSNVAGTWTHIL